MPKRCELESTIEKWYNRRATLNDISANDAHNKIIDIKDHSMEKIKYLHDHAENNDRRMHIDENGKCWIDGKPCQYRFEYYGCRGCDLKISYNDNHIVYDEDPNKRRKRK